MESLTLNKNNIIKTFERIVSSLPERERIIIEKRVWLKSERQTLQDIWDSLTPAITRERTRQLERNGVDKIARLIGSTLLVEIQNSAVKYLDIHNWIITREELINNIIKDLKINEQINLMIYDIIIQSIPNIEKSRKKLNCELYYCYSDLSIKMVNSVYSQAIKILTRRKDLIEKDVLYKKIIQNLNGEEKVTITQIDSILNLHQDIIFWEWSLVGLYKWKLLNPKTLKDKAVYVLKKEWTPMHYIDVSNNIANVLKEQTKVTTIHNVLIRNEEFTLIWRWIYALKEWWFKSGTVMETIIKVLKQSPEPLTIKEITKKVMKLKKVKQSTIYTNLQDRQIIDRVGRWYYQLRNS